MNSVSELRAQIRGINGDYNGIDYTIEGNEFLIGRHFDCDLVLKEKTVSSKHAKIIKKENYFEIEDLDSSNGTFVNKKKITKQKLRTEDIISFDKFDFRFINPNEVPRTIISTGEDFKRPDQTIHRSQLTTTTKDQEQQSNLTLEIKKEEINPELSSVGIKRTSPGFSYGLFLSLITAFTINIGFVFLIGLIRLPTLSLTGIWNSFKGLLIGFPFMHLHLYWTKAVNIDFLFVLAGVCIPVGLMLAGLIIQRSSGGNRFRNALVFSFIYVIISIFVQFAFLSFNYKSWLTINSIVGFGTGNMTISLIFTIIYYWAVSSVFAFIGALFSKNN